MNSDQLQFAGFGLLFLGVGAAMALSRRRATREKLPWWLISIFLVVVPLVTFVLAALPREHVTLYVSELYWQDENGRHEGHNPHVGGKKKPSYYLVSDGRRFAVEEDVHAVLQVGRRYDCTARKSPLGKILENCD